MDGTNCRMWETLPQRHGGNLETNDKTSNFQRYVKTNSGDQNNNMKAKHVYKVSPYGWKPPTSSKNEAFTNLLPSSEEIPEVLQPEIPSFVYFDPDNEQVDKTELIRPVFPIRPAAEAKKVCGQISKLLRDKESPSRGSRMFQKRRKRATKFTTVGYGTQPPPENDRYGEISDDETSSEELSRLDYSSEDDQIAAYDLPSLNNVLQDSELNPSEKIIKNQFKHLAMDVGSMRGKGAKIFAKRQERMENYVITDENRRQQRPPNLSAENPIPQASTETCKGPYVRPGSTIAITAKAQYKKQDSLPNVSSGYCTDFEDDFKSPLQPNINYFSDCEFSSPATRSSKSSRKARPVNRRSWETEDACLQDVGQSQQVPHDADSRPPIAPFRRVLPPGKSPYQSPAGKASQNSSISRTSLLPERGINPSSEVTQTPQRTWTRVTFNPRKPTPQQKPTKPAIDYPCARGFTTPSRSATNLPLLTDAPAQSPQQSHKISAITKPPVSSFVHLNTQPKSQRASFEASGTNRSNQQPTRKVQQPLNTAKENQSSERKALGTTTYSSAVNLLEKPMEHKEKEVPQQFHQIVLPSEVPDFVGSGDFIKLPDLEEKDFIPNDGYNHSENLVDEDQERPCSPASVASYVSSNSSTFTSTLPLRCLTPPNRTQTPTGNHRVIKLASNGTAPETPLVQQPNDLNTLRPKQNGVKTGQDYCEKNKESARPLATPIHPPAPTKLKSSPPASSSVEPHSGKKISACLKVLDPTKTLFKPKKPTEFQPSPTLSALLQSENDKSYGVMQTPPISYDYSSQKVSNPVYPSPADLRPVSKQPSSYHPITTRSRSHSSSRAPQPLGVIAEGMKGKGARMFEKQLKRMERYTKETTHDDFPELQSPNESNGPASPFSGGSFSYASATSGEKMEPGNEVKSGMRDVVGEFQKNSKKRPSETKKRGRDPLYYQQQLFYRPPSAADFVQPPPEPIEFHSEASSLTSSKPSSLSSFNTDTNKSDYQSHLAQESNCVTSPTASRTSMELDKRASISSSSMSSQKSTGPRTAPKPSRELIQRQLSQPQSPVSFSPTPEVQNFTPVSVFPSELSFHDVDKEDGSKRIEDLIEKTPDDHRTDGNTQEDFSSEGRRRTVSIGDDPSLEDSNLKPVDKGCAMSSGLFPPSYDDIMSSSMPSMRSMLPGEKGLSTFGSEGDVRKSERFSDPKLKFCVRKNGLQAQSWKPGQ